MSTISEETAKNIVTNNGYYIAAGGGKDPQCYAVFKLKNCFFGHEHLAVAYNKSQFQSYKDAGHKILEILWPKEGVN